MIKTSIFAVLFLISSISLGATQKEILKFFDGQNQIQAKESGERLQTIREIDGMIEILQADLDKLREQELIYQREELTRYQALLSEEINKPKKVKKKHEVKK